MNDLLSGKQILKKDKMATIEITDSAKVELLPILKENTKKFIRLFIQGAGWGGPRLGLALDELKSEDEKVTTNGIDVIFDKSEKDSINGSTIDFQESVMGKGYVVRTATSGMC